MPNTMTRNEIPHGKILSSQKEIPKDIEKTKNPKDTRKDEIKKGKIVEIEKMYDTTVKIDQLYNTLNNEIYGHIKSPDYNLVSEVDWEYFSDIPKDSEYARSTRIANKFEIVDGQPKLVATHLIEQEKGKESFEEYNKTLLFRDYNQHVENLEASNPGANYHCAYGSSMYGHVPLITYTNGQPTVMKPTINLHPGQYSKELGIGEEFNGMPKNTISCSYTREICNDASTLFNFYTRITAHDFLEKAAADGNDIKFNIDNLPLDLSMYETDKIASSNAQFLMLDTKFFASSEKLEKGPYIRYMDAPHYEDSKGDLHPMGSELIKNAFDKKLELYQRCRDSIESTMPPVNPYDAIATQKHVQDLYNKVNLDKFYRLECLKIDAEVNYEARQYMLIEAQAKLEKLNANMQSFNTNEYNATILDLSNRIEKYQRESIYYKELANIDENFLNNLKNIEPSMAQEIERAILAKPKDIEQCLNSIYTSAHDVLKSKQNFDLSQDSNVVKSNEIVAYTDAVEHLKNLANNHPYKMNKVYDFNPHAIANTDNIFVDAMTRFNISKLAEASDGINLDSLSDKVSANKIIESLNEKINNTSLIGIMVDGKEITIQNVFEKYNELLDKPLLSEDDLNRNLSKEEFNNLVQKFSLEQQKILSEEIAKEYGVSNISFEKKQATAIEDACRRQVIISLIEQNVKDNEYSVRTENYEEFVKMANQHKVITHLIQNPEIAEGLRLKYDPDNLTSPESMLNIERELKGRLTSDLNMSNKAIMDISKDGENFFSSDVYYRLVLEPHLFDTISNKNKDAFVGIYKNADMDVTLSNPKLCRDALIAVNAEIKRLEGIEEVDGVKTFVDKGTLNFFNQYKSFLEEHIEANRIHHYSRAAEIFNKDNEAEIKMTYTPIEIEVIKTNSYISEETKANMENSFVIYNESERLGKELRNLKTSVETLEEKANKPNATNEELIEYHRALTDIEGMTKIKMILDYKLDNPRFSYDNVDNKIDLMNKLDNITNTNQAIMYLTIQHIENENLEKPLNIKELLNKSIEDYDDTKYSFINISKEDMELILLNPDFVNGFKNYDMQSAKEALYAVELMSAEKSADTYVDKELAVKMLSINSDGEKAEIINKLLENKEFYEKLLNGQLRNPLENGYNDLDNPIRMNIELKELTNDDSPLQILNNPIQSKIEEYLNVQNEYHQIQIDKLRHDFSVSHASRVDSEFLDIAASELRNSGKAEILTSTIKEVEIKDAQGEITQQRAVTEEAVMGYYRKHMDTVQDTHNAYDKDNIQQTVETLREKENTVGMYEFAEQIKTVETNLNHIYNHDLKTDKTNILFKNGQSFNNGTMVELITDSIKREDMLLSVNEAINRNKHSETDAKISEIDERLTLEREFVAALYSQRESIIGEAPIGFEKLELESSYRLNEKIEVIDKSIFVHEEKILDLEDKKENLQSMSIQGINTQAFELQEKILSRAQELQLKEEDLKFMAQTCKSEHLEKATSEYNEIFQKLINSNEEYRESSNESLTKADHPYILSIPPDKLANFVAVLDEAPIYMAYNKSEQNSKFTSFDKSSYLENNLQFSVLPQALLQISELESYENFLRLKDVQQALQSINDNDTLTPNERLKFAASEYGVSMNPIHQLTRNEISKVNSYDDSLKADRNEIENQIQKIINITNAINEGTASTEMQQGLRTELINLNGLASVYNEKVEKANENMDIGGYNITSIIESATTSEAHDKMLDKIGINNSEDVREVFDKIQKIDIQSYEVMDKLNDIGIDTRLTNEEIAQGIENAKSEEVSEIKEEEQQKDNKEEILSFDDLAAR